MLAIIWLEWQDVIILCRNLSPFDIFCQKIRGVHANNNCFCWFFVRCRRGGQSRGTKTVLLNKYIIPWRASDAERRCCVCIVVRYNKLRRASHVRAPGRGSYSLCRLIYNLDQVFKDNRAQRDRNNYRFVPAREYKLWQRTAECSLSHRQRITIFSEGKEAINLNYWSPAATGVAKKTSQFVLVIYLLNALSLHRCKGNELNTALQRFGVVSVVIPASWHRPVAQTKRTTCLLRCTINFSNLASSFVCALGE